MLPNRVHRREELQFSLLAVGLIRLWRQGRDLVNIAVATLFWCLFGRWQYLAVFLLLALIVRYALARLPSWIAMGVTVLLVLAAQRFAIPPFPLFLIGSSWAAARLFFYAYELAAIAPSKRSLIKLLAYGPFNMLLVSSEPPMVSYFAGSSGGTVGALASELATTAGRWRWRLAM